MTLTQAKVRERYSYDPQTGILTNRRTGKAINARHRDGYIRVKVGSRPGRQYMAHRVIWLYVHGRWPEPMIDHINQIKHDNRLENLREATAYQNIGNRRGWSKHGMKGAVWNKDAWEAQIKKDGRNYYLGRFQTAEAARAAYLVKAREFFGEFAS